jgi:hypothetical protein
VEPRALSNKVGSASAVTIDSDMTNPTEELPALVEYFDTTTVCGFIRTKKPFLKMVPSVIDTA